MYNKYIVNCQSNIIVTVIPMCNGSTTNLRKNQLWQVPVEITIAKTAGVVTTRKLKAF